MCSWLTKARRVRPYFRISHYKQPVWSLEKCWLHESKGWAVSVANGAICISDSLLQGALFRVNNRQRLPVLTVRLSQTKVNQERMLTWHMGGCARENWQHQKREVAEKQKPLIIHWYHARSRRLGRETANEKLGLGCGTVAGSESRRRSQEKTCSRGRTVWPLRQAVWNPGRDEKKGIRLRTAKMREKIGPTRPGLHLWDWKKMH